MLPVKDNIPNRRFPWVTLGLILANAVAYVLCVRHGGSLISGPAAHEVLAYGAIPSRFVHSRTHVPAGTTVWLTVFTAMFLHASILQLAGNMLFLWIFGNSVETALGRTRFLLLYIVAGVAALALQVAVDPGSTAPTLGAEGSIAGVLGAYILLYPRAKVLTLTFIVLFFTVIELPALVMLALWFIEQAVFTAAHLTDPLGGGGAGAYLAYLGGFAFGVLAVRVLAMRWRPPIAVA